MKDLIEALTILDKYIHDPHHKKYPTHCEHDTLMVARVNNESSVTEEDKARLDELGFFYSDEYDCYISYRFGSC